MTLRSEQSGRFKSRPRPQQKKELHLAAILELPCVICGQYEVTEAVHLIMHDTLYSKTAAKDDEWVTPLCRAHNVQQKMVGERAFWRRTSINPFVLAMVLWRVTPNVQMMERVVIAHRNAL